MNAFITRTIIYSFLIAAVYSITVAYVLPDKYIVQHQWQDNTIKAQKFVYDNEDRNVIVGSSLAARLVMDSLKGYYNLSLNGQSIFDGLEIIKTKPQLPDTIFIETNSVLVKEDQAFTASLSNPFFYYLRDLDPAFRDGKQPLALLGNSLALNVLKPLKTDKQSIDKRAALQQQEARDVLFKQILNDKILSYSTAPDSILLKSALDNLSQYVDYFLKKGVKIVFFEMPIDAALCSLLQSTTIKDSFYERFPPEKFHYIFQPDCAGYQTTDGIHLSRSSAIKYTYFFKHNGFQ